MWNEICRRNRIVGTSDMCDSRMLSRGYWHCHVGRMFSVLACIHLAWLSLGIRTRHLEASYRMTELFFAVPLWIAVPKVGVTYVNLSLEPQASPSTA